MTMTIPAATGAQNGFPPVYAKAPWLDWVLAPAIVPEGTARTPPVGVPAVDEPDGPIDAG